jgi:hypothetical protein
MNISLKQRHAYLFFLLMACMKVSCAHRTFYVDSRSGSDTNPGTSPEKAWTSLEKVNQQVFAPGDQLLFKSGTEYIGQLEPKGSGSVESPIIISSYGEGAKPVIHGKGEKKYSLLLKNIEYYEVSKLEITNKGNEREAGRTGILIHAKDFGEMKHIILNDLEVHHINGSLVKKEGGGNAIFWRNEGDSIPSRFVGLRIENCHLHHCGRNGINSWGNTNRDKWFPSLDVVVRNNLLEEIPGDGIVPIGCDGALVEFNVMRNCPDILSHEEAAAGIWPWSSDNTLIQFNEVSHHRAKWDGQGFDADYNCSGTIIQYNYSHDNYGGFLLVCNDGNSLGKNWNKGTESSLVQFNLSFNDGIRPYPTERAGWFSPVFHISGPVKNTLIKNNIILIPEKKDPSINAVVVEMDNWGNACPVNTTISGNEFISTSTPIFKWGDDVDTNFSENNNTVQLADIEPGLAIGLLDELIRKAGSAEKEGYSKLRNFVLNQLQQ